MITAFVLLGLASGSAVSSLPIPSLRSEATCPAPGDNRDCVFYREAAAIASESLALAAYGTKDVSPDKAMELEQRLCKLVDDYGLPRPKVCQVDRMMMKSTERVDWKRLIKAICEAIIALLS